MFLYYKEPRYAELMFLPKELKYRIAPKHVRSGHTALGITRIA